MGGKYNTGGAGKDGSNMMYDDSAFQLFFAAMLAVYWIPTVLFRTYWFIARKLHVQTPLEKAKLEWCTCSMCQARADRQQAKTRGARAFCPADMVLLVVTVLLVVMSVKVYRANLTAEPPFDPFAILGVTESATPKEIKKAYRRLSVVHHPDKNRDDPAAGERFIRITKAFAALTDEASKENYAKYGNPDGYLGTTLGLGLPEWVAESGNGVLFAYFIFIVILFPLIVWMWWHQRSQQLTNEIMTKTFMLYRDTLQQTTRFRDLLAAFCASYEFRDLYTSDNDESLAALSETLKRVSKNDMKKTMSVVQPEQFQVQNLLVMSAYLARIPIPDNLKYIVEEILLRSEALLTSMTDTVGAFQRPDCQAAWQKTFMHGHTVYLATCISLTQCVVQSLDEKTSAFMQIPHFTEREVRYCTSARSPAIRSIYDFMKLDTEQKRNILRNFTDDQFLDVQAFCDRFPVANIEITGPMVEGEEDSTVHAGDTVTIRIRLTIMRRSGSAFSPHTPCLPFKKEEAWWVWLADERLMAPIEVRRLLPKMARGHDLNRRKRHGDDCCGGVVFDDHDGEADEDMGKLSSDPRVTIFDLKLNFMAPRAGDYNLEVKTACECYKGASKSKVIKMKVAKEVEPPPESEVRYFDTDDESSDEYESSEDEEEEEETDGEYEYVEVTDDESAQGDFDDDDDEFGITAGSTGNPAG